MVVELSRSYMMLSGDWQINDIFKSHYIDILSRWLLLLNSSSNMAIYAWVDKRFRQTLVTLICRERRP